MAIQYLHRKDNYLFRRIDELGLPSSKYVEFMLMVERFLKRSGEDDATVLKVMRKIRLLSDNPGHNFFWWVIEDEKGKLVGYFFCEIEENEYGDLYERIHHVYIDPTAGPKKLLREVETLCCMWAKEKNVRVIKFSTERNYEGFQKILKGNWVPECVEMKLSCA